MSYQETSKYCKRCVKQVLSRRKGTNHILHLLLSLITGGLWIIVWIFCDIKIGGWRCAQCGGKV